MNVGKLFQGQKFRIINSNVFSSDSIYVFIGVRSPRVYVVLTNLYGTANHFSMVDFPLSFLTEECELVDEQPHAEKETYIERQRAWIEEVGLKAGDTVKVLRTAEENENGWDDIWADDMDKMVGQKYKLDYINTDKISGIRVDGYWFPYFVLEKVVIEYKPFSYEDRAIFMGHLVEHKTERYSIYLASCTPHNVNGYTYQWLVDNFVWADGPDKGKPVGIESRR